VNNLRPRIQ